MPNYILRIQTTAQPVRVLAERSVTADNDEAGIQAVTAFAANLKFERRLPDRDVEIVNGPPEPVDVVLLTEGGDKLTAVFVPVAK